MAVCQSACGSAGITANVFGLCVCLPLHKCSNYSKKLIGQIAQNPCYMQFLCVGFVKIKSKI